MIKYRTSFVIATFTYCAAWSFPMLTPVNASAQAQPNAKVDFVAQAFLQKAKETQTPWREEDVQRYAEGLFSILDGYAEQLGEENTIVIREFLTTYAQEMAATVYTNLVPPSLFINAFLLDYNDRLSGLVERGGPIFPDENTRFIIKAQLSQFIENITQDLQPAGDVTANDIAAIKESIKLNLYSRADHPFRSEFKRPASPEEQQLIASLREKVSAVNFADENHFNGRRTNNINYRKAIQYSLVRSKILQPLVSSWQVEPILMSSKETQQIYEEASRQLQALAGIE